MNILISNDDGINAEGIKQLAKALATVADVYVAAPHTQRSANSHAITLHNTVFVNEIDFPCAKKAFEVSGTPADCIKMGVQLLKEEGINVDMVFAGINHGSNLGRDTLYSGTVGAAMEGALCGCLSVAVSVDSHIATHFDVAGELAVDIIPLIYGKVSPNIIMNINVPDLPREEIKGIKYTKLGGRYYCDKFHFIGEKDGKTEYKLDGEPWDFTGAEEIYDVTAANNNFASITPLHFDYTKDDMVEKIEKWNLKIKD